jgi:3-oxoacyl-[acyl-carrier-protein] synthase III
MERVSDAMNVYIRDTAAFLPNQPVTNEEMEEILGKVHGMASRVRKRILRSNGIIERHYALDRETGKVTHTNAQITAEAIRRLKPWPSFTPQEIECLACGTSSPDQILPGHASMVQGELGIGPCEVVSTAGVCVSGAMALKYAYMSVLAGLSRNAVATGSDVGSSFMRAKYHEHTCEPGVETEGEKRSTVAFGAEFLRWMLSDGAGAVFLSPEPTPNGLSLRIDWIDEVSYAGEMEVCMYAGAMKQPDGRLKGWREFDTPLEALHAGAFAVQQDVKLLNDKVVEMCVDWGLKRIAEKRGLTAKDVDWYLPHYSSEYFRDRIFHRMKAIGFEVPYQKWFTNLTRLGNVGAGAIYVILDDLFRSDAIRKGEKLLCFIPESGRFSVAYALLTAC